MPGRFIIFSIVGVSIVFVLIVGRTLSLSKSLPLDKLAPKTLRVLTYSSFMGTAGPGSRLFGEFQRICNCKLDVISAGDAGLILERLKLQQETSPFDVVVGIDQMSRHEARSLPWRELKIDMSDFFPIAIQHSDTAFIALDWSPLTFVYRADGPPPPQKFADLTDPKYKGMIALQDPRSSSPGMQFLQWTRAVNGKSNKEFLFNLKQNVQSVSPSWSFSYGLFTKNKADFVFSYVTSLAYHWGIEKNRNYKVMEFSDGHPVQVEYAAIPASCTQCDLAEKFVSFIVDTKAQQILMEKNFMFPAKKSVVANTIFAELPQLTFREVPVDRDLSDWLEVFK